MSLSEAENNMTSTSLLIKRSIKSAVSAAGVRRGFPQPLPGSVQIFAYHRVVSDIETAERESIYGTVISTASFRRHCELIRNAFDVVLLETAIHFLDQRRRVARPLAVITFDDGYADFYDNAFPVLNDLALPATMFIPTKCISRGEPLEHDRLYWLVKQCLMSAISLDSALSKAGVSEPGTSWGRNVLKLTDHIVYQPREKRLRAIELLEGLVGKPDYPAHYRLLDWYQIERLSTRGIAFAAHTSNHVVLPLENVDVVRQELLESRLELEERLGKPVVGLAYPNGENTPLIRSAASDAGYRYAVTTENRSNLPGADLMSLGRTSLCEESTRGLSGRFSEKVAGLRLGV